MFLWTLTHPAHHSCRYASATDFLILRGVSDLSPDLYSWGHDLLAFSSVVTRYVSAYVDVYWPEDAALFADVELLDFWEGLHVLPNSHVPPLTTRAVLVDVVANFIVHVTGVHNSLGNRYVSVTRPCNLAP